MFRSILVTILISAYGLATIGLPLHFHYCRGELKHVTMFVRMGCHEQEHQTFAHGCCESKPQCEPGHLNNHCCQDATKWLHEDNPAVIAQNLTFNTPGCEMVSAVINPDLRLSESKSPRQTHHVLATTGPPLYLMQCAFIFYG
jgi:hypothetical protein